MPDEHTAEEILLARLILSGAIAAAGKMDSSVAWRGRVNLMIPEVGAMLGERSTPMYHALQMATATTFFAPYVGHEIEESSTRIVLHLEHDVDDDHKDGIQYLRTERTDTPIGKMMLDRLATVEVGTNLLIFKAFEKIKSGKNTDSDAATVKHFIPFPKRDKDAGTARAGEAVPPPSAAARPDPDEAPTSSSGSNLLDYISVFNENTEHLDNKAKVALVRELVAAELWPPSTDNIDKVLLKAKEAQ